VELDGSQLKRVARSKDGWHLCGAAAGAHFAVFCFQFYQSKKGGAPVIIVLAQKTGAQLYQDLLPAAIF